MFALDLQSYFGVGVGFVLDFALACKAIWVFAVGGIKPLAKARRIGGRH